MPPEALTDFSHASTTLAATAMVVPNAPVQAQITPTSIGVPLGSVLLSAPNAVPPAPRANETVTATTTTPHRKFLRMIPPNRLARRCGR